MNITLPSTAESLLEQQLASGHYDSKEAVLVDALERLPITNAQTEQAMLDYCREEKRAGRTTRADAKFFAAQRAKIFAEA